ncbi:hypothetical protein BG006_005886 [Podila minutissima]|uniref:Uncharacterized protein n=1 Tax=Podila minutissima TaxID=64525 RepID=A0A9P5VM12_9FUNG|nr:hypothetical protein BG006_005886 [Podila minutissima]
MGTVGVNGKMTFRNVDNACILYMTIDGDITTYNNGFCLFPIIGAAITAVFSLVFLMYWILVAVKKDEFTPRLISISFMSLSFVLALLSFSICGELGIGINKGCNILGNLSHHCRNTKDFSALYGAQISAGVMGGLWLITMLLEFFQLRAMGRRVSDSLEPANQTKVTPPVGDKAKLGGLSGQPEMVITPHSAHSAHQQARKQELTSSEFYSKGQEHQAVSYAAPGTSTSTRQTTAATHSGTGVHYGK